MSQWFAKKAVWISTLALLSAVVFCVAFVFFYTRSARNATKPNLVGSGKTLPDADLVDIDNQPLSASELKNGRVVLVFIAPDCGACNKESDFLKDVIGKRSDVRFYGVISYGDMVSSLRDAKEKFPFKVFYDRGFKLAGPLGINRVPIKIFVDDGVIKKSWGGATVDEKAQGDFVRWLAEV